jgi:hypothetical protein
MEIIKISQTAEHMIGWWKAHHRKQEKERINEIANLYRLLFGLTYDDALIVVGHIVKAVDLQDIAKKYEDQKRREEADKYWNDVKMNLQKHFELLEKFRRR